MLITPGAAFMDLNWDTFYFQGFGEETNHTARARAQAENQLWSVITNQDQCRAS